jgi:hypothetical protein
MPLPPTTAGRRVVVGTNGLAVTIGCLVATTGGLLVVVVVGTVMNGLAGGTFGLSIPSTGRPGSIPPPKSPSSSSTTGRAGGRGRLVVVVDAEGGLGRRKGGGEVAGGSPASSPSLGGGSTGNDGRVPIGVMEDGPIVGHLRRGTSASLRILPISFKKQWHTLITLLNIPYGTKDAKTNAKTKT